MIDAAALCATPSALARELTGADPVMPELRKACQDATAALVHGGSDLVTVVGAGEQTRTWDADLRLDLSEFAPGICQAPRTPGPGLPLPLGLGARLLDQAGYAGRRLALSSERFRTLWARHDVRSPEGGTTTVNHPVVGELRLQRDKLPVGDVLLVLYYADQAVNSSESDEKLRLLASMAQTPAGDGSQTLKWAGTSNAAATAERQQISDGCGSYEGSD